MIEISSFWKITNYFFACLYGRCIASALIISPVVLSIFRVLLLLLAALLVYASDILVFKAYLILILLILDLNLLVKFITFLLNLLFSFYLELLNSLDGKACFSTFHLDNAFNLTILFIFENLSWLSKQTIFFCWHKIFFIFVEKSEVMLLTLFISLCLNIQVRNINPVAHTALHYSLNEIKLFFCVPIRMKHGKFKIVKNHIITNCVRYILLFLFT